LHNHFTATQAWHVWRHSELKRMKAQWNDPVTGKGAEMFLRTDFANANIAACFIDINFGVGWTDGPPVWVAALRRDKISQVGKRIKEMNRGSRGEISREETKMKIWPTK